MLKYRVVYATVGLKPVQEGGYLIGEILCVQEVSRVALVHRCMVPTMLHYGKHNLTYNTNKSSCVFNAPLADKDTHAHTKTASNTQHIETTREKEKELGGGGGGGARKGKEREKGQWEKEYEIKRVKEGPAQTKEKSVTHRERGGQGRRKSNEKPKSAKKKKKRAGGAERKKKPLPSALGGVRGRGQRKGNEKRDMEKKSE